MDAGEAASHPRVDVGEAGHTPEWNLCHPKPITHSFSLWWDSDAPEPLSGENPSPAGEKPDLYDYSRYRRQNWVAKWK